VSLDEIPSDHSGRNDTPSYKYRGALQLRRLGDVEGDPAACLLASRTMKHGAVSSTVQGGEKPRAAGMRPLIPPDQKKGRMVWQAQVLITW
jgi:hypothetical protein